VPLPGGHSSPKHPPANLAHRGFLRYDQDRTAAAEDQAIGDHKRIRRARHPCGRDVHGRRDGKSDEMRFKLGRHARCGLGDL
jgi:hypothetical protein